MTRRRLTEGPPQRYELRSSSARICLGMERLMKLARKLRADGLDKHECSLALGAVAQALADRRQGQ